MAERANVAQVYVCLMHMKVRHMISSPLHLAVMAGLMVALMVAAMMLMR